MSKLLDYLNTLDKDASARAAHNKDAKAAMAKFGLTEDEQKAVVSGDNKKIAALVGVPENSVPKVDVTHDSF